MNMRVYKMRGFTLIELLVVIAVIGLLSSVVLTSLSIARMKARDARRIADLAQIKKALEFYYDDHEYYPGTHYQDASYCTAGPPCWDICAGDSSISPTWSLLEADLLPYIKPLPKDPLNTDPTSSGCTPVTCHFYAYSSVGRFGINPMTSQSTAIGTYTLYVNLEDDNNPLSCKFNAYIGGGGCRTTEVSLCNSTYRYVAK